MRWIFLFPNWFCPSIPTGLYGAGLAGYVGFQQNRNIKGELAQASVFVFLKGTTAPTGFLGWRDERGEGVGRSPSPHSLLSFHYCAFCPSVFVSLRPSLKSEQQKRRPAVNSWNCLRLCEVSYHSLSSGLLPEGQNRIGWQVGRIGVGMSDREWGQGLSSCTGNSHGLFMLYIQCVYVYVYVYK